MEHVPVLLAETIAALQLSPDARCIDGTVGGGGHAEALLKATAPNGRLLGLDADPKAIEVARLRLAPFGERAVLVQGSFEQLSSLATLYGFTAVDAIVLDLGVSSLQLADAGRGFSFQAAGPLDMRFDPHNPLTAEEIVNTWKEEELADIIYRYGEEPRARRIARAIVAARPLHTTLALAEVVSRAVGGRSGRIHPATKVFQALRIRVNNELAALEAVLPQAIALLVSGGRLAVITFHSLEDRIVKHFMQQEARDCICPPGLPTCGCGHRAVLRIVTSRPIRPSSAEVERNPRSRSAKLRVAEKL